MVYMVRRQCHPHMPPPHYAGAWENAVSDGRFWDCLYRLALAYGCPVRWVWLYDMPYVLCVVLVPAGHCLLPVLCAAVLHE